MKQDCKEIVDGDRNYILGYKDVELEKFYVKDWNCNIYIKSMTVKEITDFHEKTKNLTDNQERNIELFIAVVCNKDGSLMFNENHRDDLKEKSVYAINLVVAKINKNMLKKAEDLEEEAKNF